MTITAYAGFSASPSTSANRNSTVAYSSLPLNGLQLFGEAVDSNDPSASFSWSWSVLNNRTGQTATIGSATTQNTTLDNVAAQWGDVRIFLVATNTGTGETSENNPLLAPDTSQCFLHVESTNKQLTRPALGSRNWYVSLDNALQALEDITEPQGGIQSATVNGAGDLILTLQDNSTINAGNVEGTDGTDGISVSSASINASNELILTMSDSSTINAGTLPTNTTQKHTFSGTVHSLNTNAGSTTTGLQPTKEEVIWGGFVASQAYDCLTLAITVKDAGSATNTADFYLFSMSTTDWNNASSPSSFHVGSALTITQGAINNQPKTQTANLSAHSISSGQVFGVSMTAPSNSAMHHVSFSLILEDQ
jgi:hypothetical protein